MEVELLTLSGVKFRGTASMVSLVAADGEMGILPHHEPYTARLVAGPVTIHTNGKKQVFALCGGLLEITSDRVRLLADEADHEDDIVAAEAEQALERAEEMKTKAKNKLELSRAQYLVDRESVRLNVAKMRRGKRPTKPQ